MVDVAISESARETLKSLDSDIAGRIRDKLLGEVSENPERYLSQLEGTDLKSIRVGDYRVLAELDREVGALKVHHMGHRKNVYDREL
jgi:mRNA-degrading endonuclease RelE of RelBE toxin-antitoxin system